MMNGDICLDLALTIVTNYDDFPNLKISDDAISFLALPEYITKSILGPGSLN